ncbi:MAG TPA: hypothetical protein VLB00_11380 [Gemmatimonadales bacterium]|nr:hypothetical protein [Gemmatimonadales bacterium]
MPDRRRFLVLVLGAMGSVVPGSGPLLAMGRRLSRSGHPTPRPGITSAKVLTAEQLADSPQVIPVFDAVRAIPEVVDGIRCKCGCADLEGFYSLLSCYEDQGMARHCPICQGEGRMVARLHKEGKTLDEIRQAVDARWG